MVANNSSEFPFQSCLIPDLPEEIQLQVRSIGNYVFNPVGLAVAIISLICNSLVVITVARTRSLHHPSLIMICSLALTDVIYSSLAVYEYIEILTHKHMCPQEQLTATVISIFCNLATLGNLAMISKDRFLAVKRPWWYRNHVNKSRVIKAMCLPWLVSAIIAFVVYLSKTRRGLFLPLGQMFSLLFFAICACAIMFYYLNIYFRKTTPLAGRQICATVEREKHLTNTVALILLVLLLTFLPAIIFPLVMFLNGVQNLWPFKPFFSFFFQLHAILNPLLNFGRCKEMRKALIALFKCFHQVQPSSCSNTSNIVTNSNINENVSDKQNTSINSIGYDNKNNNDCNNKNNNNNENINDNSNGNNNDVVNDHASNNNSNCITTIDGSNDNNNNSNQE